MFILNRILLNNERSYLKNIGKYKRLVQNNNIFTEIFIIKIRYEYKIIYS